MVAEGGIVGNPVFSQIARGEFSRRDLAFFTQQFLLRQRHFTRWLACIYARTPNEAHDARQLIAENLYEEHGDLRPGRDHTSLLKQFGRALGLKDQEMEEALPLPETQAFIDRIYHICRSSFIEGMAAIGIGHEGHALVQRPEAAGVGRFAQALREHYGLSEDDVEFWSLHARADVDHCRRALEMVKKYAVTAELQEKAKRAVEQTLRQWRFFFDGILRALGKGSGPLLQGLSQFD